VDGVSDQSLAYFFAPLPAQSVSPHIQFARYVVQWDVMSGTGYPEELANLRRWYTQALALGLTPDVALDNYDCEGCAAPQTTAQYNEELHELFRAFPDIKIVEAWNEPNDSHYSSYVPPAAAAGFMNAAYAFCREDGCTAIAGDLLDSEANMLEYEHQYEGYLEPSDPGDWGIHPYHAVKYMTATTVASFQEALPDPATDRLWFTEVGAYYCAAGTTYGEAVQAQQERFLLEDLIPEFQPQHVFYYELAWRYDERPPCADGQADTALYAARSRNGPLLPRAAAAVTFGSQPPPIVSAMAATAEHGTPSVPPAGFACEPGPGERLFEIERCSDRGAESWLLAIE
jgi:hypothetical protein